MVSSRQGCWSSARPKSCFQAVLEEPDCWVSSLSDTADLKPQVETPGILRWVRPITPSPQPLASALQGVTPIFVGKTENGSLCLAEIEQQTEENDQNQQAQTPVTTSPSASSTTSFMSSSLEDTTTATTPVTDTETVPASESPGVLPLSLLRYLLISTPRCFAEFGLSAAGWPAWCYLLPLFLSPRRQMFSSYPTTAVLPTRRAQTPPISSLPTSPSDDVGRRQSLTSPDSQPARPANRTGEPCPQLPGSP